MSGLLCPHRWREWGITGLSPEILGTSSLLDAPHTLTVHNLAPVPPGFGRSQVSTMQLLWGHPCVYEKGRQFAAMIDNMDLDRNLFFGLSSVPVVSLASSPQGKLTL